MRNPPLAKRLTPRDAHILLWIGLAGIASQDQVARRFWGGKSRRTADERMRRLVRSGYLEMHGCSVRTPGEPVFCITEQAYREFGSAQRERLQVGLPSPSEIRQQLMAQDAYLLLEANIVRDGSRLVDWRPERELRAEFQLAHSPTQQRKWASPPADIPDAQVTIITGQGEVKTLYVEIDGVYYGKMLCEKAKCLGKSEHNVVWVCTQERAGYVEKAVAGYPNIQVLVI